MFIMPRRSLRLTRRMQKAIDAHMRAAIPRQTRTVRAIEEPELPRERKKRKNGLSPVDVGAVVDVEVGVEGSTVTVVRPFGPNVI